MLEGDGRDPDRPSEDHIPQKTSGNATAPYLSQSITNIPPKYGKKSSLGCFVFSFFLHSLSGVPSKDRPKKKKKKVIYVDSVFYDLLTVNSDL